MAFAMTAPPLPLPLSKRMAPITKAAVRYSDVAHFVTMSMINDPSLARSRRKFSEDHIFGKSVTSVWEEDEVEIRPSSSLPSLYPAEKADLIRSQIRRLKATERAEREQLFQLETSLRDSKVAEAKATARADQSRRKRDNQKDQLRQIHEKMHKVQDASRAHHAKVTGMPALPVRRRSMTGVRRRSVHTIEIEGHLAHQGAHAAAADIATALEAFNMHDHHDHQKGDADEDSQSEQDDQGKATAPTSPTAATASRLGKVDGPPEASKPEIQGLTLELLDSFENEIDLAQFQRQAVRNHMMEKVGNEIKVFKSINLNGSGRICSQEFADGVERLGVPWKTLTGFDKPRELFRLFDANKDGVITLLELFPSYEKPKDDSGYDTPQFWEMWERENFAESHDGRIPKWQSSCSDDGLSVMYYRDRMEYEAAFKRKTLQLKMRRMKGQGKSDARCREMLAHHLPKGTGPHDLQNVPTFSEVDVKQVRREYNDAMNDPQRKVLRHIYDLRESRKELSASRHNFFHVAIEPILQQQFMEEQKQFFQAQSKNNKSALAGLGGLGGLLRKEAPESTGESEPSEVAEVASVVGSTHGSEAIS